MTWTPERIQQLRRRLSLTQTELAERMGVRQATVSDWERGKQTPTGASVTLLEMLEQKAEEQDASS